MLSSLVRVFDFGGQWGSATVRLVEGNNASITIRKIESMLEDSMKILQSHEKLLSTHQYNTFSIKHRRLLLKVVEIKNEVQSRRTAGTIDAQIHNSELARIHDQTEIYHRDVISASRRAQLDEESRLLGENEETEMPPNTMWYSVITPQSNSSSNVLQSSDTTSDIPDSANREPFVAVAHVREKNPASSFDSPGDGTYRRIIIMESREKRMIMIDPNPCYLDREPNPMNENSLLEMSRAGETLLRATEPDSLSGFEVLGKSDEPSWIDSLIDTMARLGAGVSTTTV